LQLFALAALVYGGPSVRCDDTCGQDYLVQCYPEQADSEAYRKCDLADSGEGGKVIFTTEVQDNVLVTSTQIIEKLIVQVGYSDLDLDAAMIRLGRAIANRSVRINISGEQRQQDVMVWYFSAALGLSNPESEYIRGITTMPRRRSMYHTISMLICGS